MLGNYIILMSRKYKSWGGLSWINLVGLIGVYGLIFILIRGFITNPDTVSLVIILLILFVAAVAYINYVTLQLRRRTKEFYVRKLIGAKDNELLTQILLESTVLTSFLVISGMVLAELATPWCGKILGAPITFEPIGLAGQALIVLIIVLPIGVGSVFLPVRNYIGYVKENFSKLSHRSY